MSEVIIERLKSSIGKVTTIFLHNGFRYKGRITNCDDKYVEVLDFKTNSYKLIEIVDIKDADVEVGV